jgi:hypothetical protein
MPHQALAGPAITCKNDVVADENLAIELHLAKLQEITGYAVACAEPALVLFERDCADGRRARAALEAARRFGVASPAVVSVLMRYPSAPSGGGRVGELLRQLDASLRRLATGRYPNRCPRSERPAADRRTYRVSRGETCPTPPSAPPVAPSSHPLAPCRRTA